MGFAILMGSTIPLSVSLLSDFNMPNERGVAQSIYAAGVYLGVGMSGLSIILDNGVGWRNTIRIICGILWLCAIPMIFVPEPIRNETNRIAAEEIAKAEEAKASVTFDDLPERAETAGSIDDNSAKVKVVSISAIKSSSLT